MKITRQSMTTGVTRTREIDVTLDQMNAYYVEGKLVQDAFPHLSPSDREFIMTGMTDEDWEEATREQP